MQENIISIKKQDTLLSTQKTKFSFYRANRLFLLLMAAAFAGLTAGTLAFEKMPQEVISALSAARQNYLDLRTYGQAGEIILSSILSASLLLGAEFLLGFCAIAQPAEFFAVFFKGLGIGVSVTQIYYSMGTEGIKAVIILILPGAMLSTFSLVLGAKEAVRLSNTYATLSLTSENRLGIREEIRMYCIRFMVLEGALIVSAVLDVLMSLVYVRYA